MFPSRYILHTEESSVEQVSEYIVLHIDQTKDCIGHSILRSERFGRRFPKTSDPRGKNVSIRSNGGFKFKSNKSRVTTSVITHSRKNGLNWSWVRCGCENKKSICKLDIMKESKESFHLHLLPLLQKRTWERQDAVDKKDVEVVQTGLPKKKRELTEAQK